jgi:hypothetical protein
VPPLGADVNGPVGVLKSNVQLLSGYRPGGLLDGVAENFPNTPNEIISEREGKIHSGRSAL